MAVVHLPDWRFRPEGDLDKGKAAIAEYVDYLRADESGLQLSLWLKDREEPLRYFHVAVYESVEALERASSAEGTRIFVEKLYPEIDGSTHTYPVCDVLLSSGGQLPSVMP